MQHFDPMLPPFEAGAHIEVAVGEGVIRSYSLANDPRDTGRYVIAVLREPDGRGSGWLHGSVRVGDTLQIAGPRNAFPLREEAAEHVPVAGGVGITPIRSMIHRLQAIGAPFRVIYCTRTARACWCTMTRATPAAASTWPPPCGTGRWARKPMYAVRAA